MQRPPHSFWPLFAGFALALLAPRALADRNVAVVSRASPEYTQRKFGAGKPQAESYVFMQGNYFEGVTVDRSIEKMTFRQLAEFLAPELARAHYFPATDPKASDLLLVVHWGTTRPRATNEDLRAKDIAINDPKESPEAKFEAMTALGAGNPDGPLPDIPAPYDAAFEQGGIDNLERLMEQVEGAYTVADNARLLGYGSELRKFSRNALQSTKEEILRFDLRSERYFIVVMAYDLRTKPEPGKPRRAIWSLHANSSSPGNNFTSALNLMGDAAVDFFGRTSEGVATVQPGQREGTVTLAPLIILGEVK